MESYHLGRVGEPKPDESRAIKNQKLKIKNI
jgi:hypothetical protein